jgi:hypothetical protein
MFKIILYIFLTVFPFILFAQKSEGNIKIIQDPKIDSLLSLHIELNEEYTHIEGWRINIFFEAGNYSKRMAVEAKSKFVNSYSDVPCYLVFQEPYYKVRVGDYRTKMEAEKFLHEIEREYPNAFVVKDNINFPKLD